MRKSNLNKSIPHQGTLDGKYRGLAVGTLALAIVMVLVASYVVMQIMERNAHSSAEKLVSTVVEHVDAKTNEME